MQPLYLSATPTSPEVDFRFEQHSLSIKGESYPENAAAFYGPLIEQVQNYLATCDGQSITVNVSLAYFNSSSTKMLFTFFDALNRLPWPATTSPELVPRRRRRHHPRIRPGTAATISPRSTSATTP
jgi:hypothetical protein